LFDLNLPFNTIIGLNEERTNAGYNPATNPVINTKAINKNIHVVVKNKIL
jgi:hypothetical protein